MPTIDFARAEQLRCAALYPDPGATLGVHDWFAEEILMEMEKHNYKEFLKTKADMGASDGFPVVSIPDMAFPFQRSLIEWSCAKGRAALFADCGLGKTIMQLTFADNATRQTAKHSLVLTPLAVAAQTITESEKFGIECVRSKNGELPRTASVVVTNYQRLDKFNPNDFGAVICDESSILKNFDGATKAAVTEFMRTVPYRLLCTATAAPNDYMELGTSAEALGYMGYYDMLAKFFKRENGTGGVAWGRDTYRLRAYAERDFWRWVVSFSRAVRRPSDVGFSDEGFDLPALTMNEHVIHASVPREGQLFDTPARTLPEQKEERRRTIKERCEKVAQLVEKHDSSVMWCHLNPEGDLLKKLVKGAEQISGTDSDERKEELLVAFASGQLSRLITKPQIAGYGLNWQRCAHQATFPSHSFEQFYQGVRRCWRFGQKRSVTIDMVSSEGEAGVLANLNRKAAQAEKMFANMVELMNNELNIDRSTTFKKEQETPSWL
jgi:hypothetical protein